MLHHINRIIFALFVLSLSQAVQAYSLLASPTIQLNELQQQSIRAPAEFLITDKNVTLNTVPLEQFQPLTQQHVNQGISDRAFWIRFQLSNPSAQNVDWVLQHETSYIDNIEVFLQNGNAQTEHFKLSDREPFHSRPLDYRTLAFTHTTEAHSSTNLYLKLYFDKADSVTLNFILSEAGVFADQKDREYFLYGLFYGAMLILIAISFLGAVLLKQWGYLLYTAFLICSSLMWALLNGFAYQFLWPTSVFWHNEGFHILFLLVAASAFVFSRHFLMTRLQFPRLDKLLTWLPLVLLGAIGLRFAGFYESILYVAMLSIISLISLSLLGLMAYRSGLGYARWYALAWVVYGCVLVLSVISATTTLLPWGMDSLVYAQLGTVIEAIMLLIALGDKLRRWEMDHQQVLKLAHQDALTGLNNRRVIPEAISALHNAFLHNGKPVFLALLDLDNFKQINDHYGHKAGDEVLTSLADLMQTLSRTEDVCIRQGGDEFMILFQAGSIDKAIEKMDRIRRTFHATRFEAAGAEFVTSISAGISPLFQGETILSEQTAFRQADQALYRAKQTGGNGCLAFSAENSRSHTAILQTQESPSHKS